MATAWTDDLTAVLPEVLGLLASYARFVDGREAEAFSRIFGDSGVFALGEREISGPEDLAAFAAGSPAGVHVQGVPVMEQQADGSLRAISNFVFVNSETHQVVAGEYRDEIVRSGDGLVFRRRQVETRVKS
jgi:hypothetical protein